ncbi:hypothetical protein ES708_16625 [subsurface metagenome]
MNEIDLAYAAGIVDGEGYIQIQRHKRSDYSAGYHYYMAVAVVMVDPLVPIWLEQTFGGSLYNYERKEPNAQPYYRWTTGTKKAQWFLELILPYLKTKRAQAEIAIEFQKMKTENRKVSYHRYNLKPIALLEAESILAEKCRALNSKGQRG